MSDSASLSVADALSGLPPEEIAALIRACFEELDRRSADDLHAAQTQLVRRLDIARAEAVLIDAALEMVRRAQKQREDGKDGLRANDE